MGDWKPEHHEELDAKDKYGGSGGRSDIYLWIIPAKVAGSWQSQLTVRGKPVSYEIALDQQYQVVSGTARVAGRTVKLQNAKLVGDQLSFEFTADVDSGPVKHVFSGTVADGLVSGTADLAGGKLQAKLDWSARRSAPRPARAAAAITAGSTH
jgi:hypothetical protein